MFPVMYELGFYIPVDDILHSDRRENLKSLHKYFWLTVEVHSTYRERRLCDAVTINDPSALGAD
jgi:hypothetical protein